MKQVIILFILLAILLSGAHSAYASSGAVIGKLYSSDILVTINGNPMPSYNINGKMVIALEDLADYGFNVSFEEDSRHLFVRAGYGIVTTDKEITRSKKRKAMGHLCKTDITAFLNGEEIASYTMGNKTYVYAEELGDLTDSVSADSGYSRYYMKREWDEESRTVSITALMNNASVVTPLKEYGYGSSIIYEKGADEGDITITNSPIADTYYIDTSQKAVTPLQVYHLGKPTGIYAGYVFDGMIQLYGDNLEMAFESGYYQDITPTYEERLAELYNNPDWIFEEKIDTDFCSIIYGSYVGGPHGAVSKRFIIYKDGRVEDLYAKLQQVEPIKSSRIYNLEINSDGTKLYFDSDYRVNPETNPGSYETPEYIVYHFMLDLETDVMIEITPD